MELLKISDTIEDWMPGPDMPIGLDSAGAVSDGKVLTVAGGTNPDFQQENKIHQLSCSNGSCQWKTLVTTLKQARALTVAILIPDDMSDCN